MANAQRGFTLLEVLVAPIGFNWQIAIALVPGMAAREAWLTCVETMSGGRVHPMVTRIGGLAYDAPTDWGDQIHAAIAVTKAQIPAALDAIEATVRPGIARLTGDAARLWSVGGPVARASGLDEDLRRDAPGLAYAELGDVLRVVAGEAQGAGYASPAGEQVRTGLNNWIRSSGAFDGVIDFATATGKQRKELIAKACNFVRSSDKPMASAATSMSRTAIHPRPMRPCGSGRR